MRFGWVAAAAACVIAVPAGAATYVVAATPVQVQPGGSLQIFGNAPGSTLRIISFDYSVDRNGTFVNAQGSGRNPVASGSGSVAASGFEHTGPRYGPSLIRIAFSESGYQRSDLAGFTISNVVVEADSQISVTTLPGVPEPASWAMMIGGFGMVGGIMRRRRAPLSLAPTSR